MYKARGWQPKAASGWFALLIIIFYFKVLKDLIKVSGLREAESIIELIINNFYFKIKVIGT